jgi:hypothetical protein
MSRPTICIKPEEFNKSNLEMKEPKVYKSKYNNISTTTSEILYRNNKGELCDLYIALPQIETYGPSPQYSFNSKVKSPDDIQGYTISYSKSEVESMFESLYKVCVSKINEYAKQKMIKKCTLKPTFNYRTKLENDKKVEDKTKNKVAYFKLKTSKGYSQTKELAILTPMLDKSTKEVLNPHDVISKPGLITPMIHIKRIYFGAHGNTNYGASIQIEVSKLLFKHLSSNVPDFPVEDFDTDE